MLSLVSLLCVAALRVPPAVVTVLDGDGVFTTCRKQVALPAPLVRLTRTPWGSPLGDHQPRQEFWGCSPSWGVRLEY